MKTLVVLSVLAVLSAAAPPTPDHHNFRPTVHSFPVPSIRGKKSTLPEDVLPVADESGQIAADADAHEARTLGLKKKLILKKKHGSHKLFRDSSEEKAEADSKELCTKEVKVKFCEQEHAAQAGDLNNTKIEDSPKLMSDSEVKQNIQMAKEVVETIQKMAQKMGKSANDAEIQEDIEIARQALDHIQQNFEKLESLSLRVARLSEAEALHDSHLESLKPENERMAQWEGLQQNVKKANLENSFKSSEHQSTVKEIKSPKTLESASLVMTPDPVQAKSTEHNSELTLSKNVSEDLAIAASEPHETVVKFSEKSSSKDEPVKLANEPRTELVQPKELVLSSDSLPSKSANIKEKSAASGDLFVAKTAVKEIGEPKQLKASDGLPAAKMVVKEVEEPKLMKPSETMIDSNLAASETIMKSVPVETRVIEPNHLLIETEAKNSVDMKKSPAEGMVETNDDKNKKTEEKIRNAKAVEDLMPIMKSNDDNPSKDAMTSLNHHAEGINKMMKATKEEELNSNSNQFTTKSFDQQVNKDQQVKMESLVPKAKSVEAIAVQHFEPSDLDSQLKSWSPTMKTADPVPHHSFHGGVGVSDTFHSHSHHVGISNSHHHLGHLGHLHHGHPLFKASDMDGAQSAMQMNVKEAAEKSTMDNQMMQWNPNQKAALEKSMSQWSHNHAGSARGAYGGGAAYAGSSATSAVFPGSKTSPCAIPLLLSCSPNIVHGALTSHSYGATGYRSEGANFHSKRDTNNNNEIHATKVKRKSEKTILKTTTKIQQ